MIEARVRVVSAAKGLAWVTSSEQSGCSACQSQASCGISGLGKYLSRRRPALPLPQADARAGDEFLVHVEESELLRAGLFTYLMPSLLAVLAAALADAQGAGDPLAVLAAGAGFVVGIAAARFLAPTPVVHTAPLTLSPSTPRRTP
jgi:positive regulator of sigma E activity